MPKNNESKPNYKLRDARINKNWTQAGLAEELKVAVRTIQRWENGEAYPPKTMRDKMCILFGMTEDELGFKDSTPEPDEDRKIVLNVLRKRYNDKLEERPSGGEFISLGFHECFDLVHPKSGLFQRSWGREQARPEGTTIVNEYDRVTRGLLILGKPGAGKTTLLYQLADVLLGRARHSESIPVPVILNLSSWAKEQLPLVDWVVEELKTSYGIPPQLGQQWLESRRFQLLLDGLDEVGTQTLSACIKAVNTYHQTSSLPFVICSREEEFLHQDAPVALTVQSTVVVQPLTLEQIDTYLDGPSLESLREEVRTNPTLYDLLKTPLMLNTAVTAYQGQASDPLPEDNTTDTLKRQMFTSYLNQMLLGLEKQAQIRMRRQLRWLAQRMHEHKLSVFYLEQLQPDWLPLEGGLRWLYIWLGVRLPGILIGFLLACLVISFFGINENDIGDFFVHSLPGAIVGGLLSTRYTSPSEPSQLQKRNSSLSVWGCAAFLGVGLAAVLMLVDLRVDSGYTFVGGPIFGTLSLLLTLLLTPKQPSFQRSHFSTLQPSSLRKYLWGHIRLANPWRDGLLIGLLGGLSWGLLRGLTARGLIEGTVTGMVFALVYTLIGILTASILMKQGMKVPPVEMMDLSLGKFWRSLTNTKHLNTILLIGTATCLIFGLGVAYYERPSFGWVDGGRFGAICALGTMVNYWFLVGLFHGLSRDTMSTEELSSIPNQRIRWSGLNGLYLGLIAGIVGAFIAGITILLSIWITDTSYLLSIDKQPLTNGLYSGLLIGFVTFLTAGIVIGLAKGGMTWWRHWVLRVLLWSDRVLPWYYENLLEEACRRNLLCKEGREGYRFLHALFQDYCASLGADHN